MPTPNKKTKKVPPTPPVATHDPVAHTAISDMMVHNERHHKTREHEAEATIMQGARTHKTLDHTLEHAAQMHQSIKENGKSIDDMHEGLSDKLDEVSAAAKAPDIQKVSIVGSDDENEQEEDPQEADDEKALSKVFFKMLRGKRGPKGEKHTDEEIAAIVQPIVENIMDSIRPTKDELLSLINSVMPDVLDGVDGEDGQDGEDPSDERIQELIMACMPSEDQLKNIIIPLIPEDKDVKIPTIDEIIEALKGRIRYGDLAEKPNLDTFLANHKGLGGTGYLHEISDVDAGKIKDGQVLVWNAKLSKWLPATPSTGGGGGGYTYAEIPSGAIDGSNVTFTLANTPTAPSLMLLNLGGAILSQLGGSPDYTISGNTITMASAPVAPATMQAFYS